MEKGKGETRRSVGAAILLAVLPSLVGLYGIGHIYVGRIRRGIVILLGGLILSGIELGVVTVYGHEAWCLFDPQCLATDPEMLAMLLPWAIGDFVLFIWQVVNARTVCREHNAELGER